MPNENNSSSWMTIRVGRGTLSFALSGTLGAVDFEPYVVKSGVSTAANLREAFKNSRLLCMDVPRARVMIDSDVLVVPIEKFKESDMAQLYHFTYPGTENEQVYYNVLPDLNAVALFAVNKDLQLVLNDHYRSVKLLAASSPVWRYLHQRSYTGSRNKLFGYFHEQQLNVLCFQQNRFKFCNSFSVKHSHDALYFLLYVWKQLRLQPQFDELHLVGDIDTPEWLQSELRKYLHKVFVISPAVDFNQVPATQVAGMPYDMMTLFVKGR